MACGPWKESLDFCGYPDAKIFNGIFTTLANFHTPDGLVIFNEFSLHVRLLAITCFRLQVSLYDAALLRIKVTPRLKKLVMDWISYQMDKWTHLQ